MRALRCSVRVRLARSLRQAAATISAPSRVVADEGDVAAPLPPGRRACRCRAGRRRSAAPCRGSSRRPAARRAGPGRPRRARRRSGRGPPRPRASCSSTASVWPWTSRWWLGPCSTSRSAASSGSTTGGEAELVEQGEAAQRVGAADQPAQLDQLPLAGGLGRACDAAERASSTVPGSSSKPSSAASRAARSRRSGSAAKLPGADHAQNTALEVGEAAVRVDRLAAGERHGDRADAEVALAEVGLDRRPAQGADVGLPGPVASDHPPGRELGRELEGVPVAERGDRPGRRLRARRRRRGRGR